MAQIYKILIIDGKTCVMLYLPAFECNQALTDSYDIKLYQCQSTWLVYCKSMLYLAGSMMNQL